MTTFGTILHPPKALRLIERARGPLMTTELPYDAGVYRIFCTAEEASYIGSSRRMGGRIKEHRIALLKGSHHCRALQDLFTKHGGGAFVVEVLVFLPDQTTTQGIRLHESRHIGRYANVLNTKPEKRLRMTEGGML